MRLGANPQRLHGTNVLPSTNFYTVFLMAKLKGNRISLTLAIYDFFKTTTDSSDSRRLTFLKETARSPEQLCVTAEKL